MNPLPFPPWKSLAPPDASYCAILPPGVDTLDDTPELPESPPLRIRGSEAASDSSSELDSPSSQPAESKLTSALSCSYSYSAEKSGSFGSGGEDVVAVEADVCADCIKGRVRELEVRGARLSQFLEGKADVLLRIGEFVFGRGTEAIVVVCNGRGGVVARARVRRRWWGSSRGGEGFQPHRGRRYESSRRIFQGYITRTYPENYLTKHMHYHHLISGGFSRAAQESHSIPKAPL